MNRFSQFFEFINILIIIFITFSINECKSEIERQFYASKHLLEWTKNEPLIEPKPCMEEHPIVVFIKMFFNGTQSRKWMQMLRNTWVKEVKSHNISVYFYIGRRDNEAEQELYESDAQTYGDILQFDIIDGYYNLTLKAISTLRWINK